MSAAQRKRPFTMTIETVAPYRVTLSIDSLQLSVDELLEEIPRVMYQLAAQHEAALQMAVDAAESQPARAQQLLALAPRGSRTIH